MKPIYLATAFTLLLSSIAGAQTPDAATIRAAMTRGFAALQTAQKVSHTSQSCTTTCHLQAYGALAYRAVRDQGIVVDESVEAADALRGLASLRDLSVAVEHNALGEVAMNGAFFLVAAHALGLPPSIVTSALARAIAMQQNPEGDWPSLYTRPPANASSFTFTAIGLRALQLYAHPSRRDDTERRIARARAWLESHAAGETEDRAYQLLGLSWAGAPRAKLDALAAALAAAQQADGGWTSLDGHPSNAYATGEALVALQDAGAMPTSSAAWQRGLSFLIRTQAADGTWHVRSRLPSWVSPPYYESGYPYGHDQFISTMGAAWALMAMSRALGVAGTVDHLPLADTRPSALEPWIDTAMFGSVADLRDLLDRGLDPNAITSSGRIPLLSLVVPDTAKVKLLIERGANVNARSQLRYSPLLVAAQYREANDTIRLLLANHAEIAGAPEGGRPFAGAHPMFFAAHAGNAALLPVLKNAGDSRDAPTVLFGTSPYSPLAAASQFGHVDAVRALLDLGAAPDPAVLKRSILSNRVAVVRLLLDAGADVNHVDDATGMTPLMYASAIDFGDSTMVDMLLAAGARPEVKDKEGLTALDRARHAGNLHLVPSLEHAAPHALPVTQSR